MKILLSNKPYILKNNDFKTIQIKVIFPYKLEIDSLAKLSILPDMLQFLNNKYPTREKFTLKRKELYILGTYCNTIILGEYSYIAFNMIIPDTYSIKEDLLEEQFSFFSNIIYNPLIKDNKFSSFELTKEKENICLGIDNALKNIRPYQSIRIKELVDDIGILSRDLARNKSLIEKTNTSNLYEFYQDIIIKNQPAIFVMGNVDEEEINKLCSKYLYKSNKKTQEYNINLNYFLKPRNEITKVIEESDFNNSTLSLVYKVKNMTDNDKIYLDYICDLLNSLSSRLLIKKLRDELDLVYSIKVKPYSHYGLIEITAFINAKNENITKEKIIEVMESLKNPEVIKEKVSNLKDRRRIELIKKSDNKGLIFEDFIAKSLKYDITLEEYYEKYKKITSQDISKFMERLVLDTIYLLKEKEHE